MMVTAATRRRVTRQTSMVRERPCVCVRVCVCVCVCACVMKMRVARQVSTVWEKPWECE